MGIPQARSKFVDAVKIFVSGGAGGAGHPRYGGIGGKGGSIYAQGKPSGCLVI